MPPFRHTIRFQLAVLRATHMIAELPAECRGAVEAMDLPVVVQAVRNFFQCRHPADDLTVAAALTHVRLSMPIFSSKLDALLVRLWRLREHFGKKRRAALLTVVAVLALLAAGAITDGVRAHRFHAWTSRVAPNAASVADLRRQIQLMQDRVSSLPALPPGVHVHALAAEHALQQAGNQLNGLIAWTSDPQQLRAIYEAAKDPDQAAAQDSAAIASARRDMDSANQLLEQASMVQSIADKWGALNTPGAVPEELYDLWQTRAAALRQGLQSGDVSSLSAADRQLSALTRVAGRFAEYQHLIASLRPEAATFCRALLAELTGQLQKGNLAGIDQDTEQFDALATLAPLSYRLFVATERGTYSGITRVSPTEQALRYYIVVHAVDPAGKPLRIPVYDAEMQSYRNTDTFALQVPRETYDQFAARKHGEMPMGSIEVGEKRAGAIAPTYSISTLDGTITTESAWKTQRPHNHA